MVPIRVLFLLYVAVALNLEILDKLLDTMTPKGYGLSQFPEAWQIWQDQLPASPQLRQAEAKNLALGFKIVGLQSQLSDIKSGAASSLVLLPQLIRVPFIAANG